MTSWRVRLLSHLQPQITNLTFTNLIAQPVTRTPWPGLYLSNFLSREELEFWVLISGTVYLVEGRSL